MRQSQQAPQHDPYEEQPPTKGAYDFNEDMADPFGSKKAAVMNTPPKSNPMAGGGMGGGGGAANFHDEFAN